MEKECVEQWADERLEQLKEGDYVATPGGDIPSAEVPPWYDEKLFNKAKEVYREYFASVNFSHLCGLLLSFYFTKNIKTLNSTGESSTKYNLFHRYHTTMRYTQKWYEGDVWDPKDEAHKLLTVVRSMHARVAKKMSELNDGIVYVSQWDMAVTQWAFVGPLVLFRSKVGLHSMTEEQFESLIHFWRVIGYLLGIEDEYNLCGGEYKKVLAACQHMLDKEYKGQVALADPSSVSMSRNVANALTLVNPTLAWNPLSQYIHELVGIPCPEKLSLIDWFNYYVAKFSFLFVVQFPGLRALFNDFFRWRLEIADKKDLEFKQANKYVLPQRTREG